MGYWKAFLAAQTAPVQTMGFVNFVEFLKEQSWPDLRPCSSIYFE